MAKGQKRRNRELKKPKAKKPAMPAGAPPASQNALPLSIGASKKKPH